MNDTDRAREIIERSRRAEGLSAARRKTRRRRKVFLKVEDLATHPEPNLAVEQLAPYWNVEVQTVRKWIREDALPGFRVGRSLRVKKTVALAFEKAGQLKKAV